MAYRGFRLTAVWLLIAINLLLFIATVINQDLILLLGLQPANFFARPWTIVTNLFIHGGIWHILANMLTLYFFGSFLSRLIGTRNFLLVYFGGGILGNIFYLLLAPSPFSIAIGASGAIFTLAGVLVVMMPNLRVLVYFIVPLPLWVVVLVFFVLWSFIPGVAWQAHLGGLVFGLVAGYIFRRRERYFYTWRQHR
jgi:membrane associated rhomboid family serine protease